MKYIHQLKAWPTFGWDAEALAGKLSALRLKQGRLIESMESLGFPLRAEAVLRTLTTDVLKSSEIEGENLDKEQVRSSIARRLGMEAGGLTPVDRNVEGVVDMMLNATQNYQAKLTAQRLFDWHAALFPTERSGMRKIRAGKWRDDSEGPMQVVSGPMGKERVHYEAPPAAAMPGEMKAFLAWLNGNEPLDPILKSAIAHLWFVTIHPFDDGNGRIARAIADMLLAKSEASPRRFYSMSARIQTERKAYYRILESTQRGDLDITDWLTWFLDRLDRAFDGAGIILADVLKKARFWKLHGGEAFNERQKTLLNRLLDGFEGKLTSSKWAAIGKCSQDTASRDIEDLTARGILVKGSAGGRSTSYELAAV